MKCMCGREISEKVVSYFGDLSTCHVCAQTSVEARKASVAIKQIINEIYAWKGEDGIKHLKKELLPTLKEFGLF